MLKLKYAGALLATLFVAAACSTAALGGARDDDHIRQVEQRVGDFDPRYVQASKGRHLAVFFRSVDDAIVLDPSVAPQLRTGRLRYFPPANTDFRVAYHDRDGRELGSYFVEDPRVMRVCDGPNRRTVRVQGARFEVVLPADPAITTLELGDPQRPIRVQVDSLIARAMASQPDSVRPPR